MRIPGRWRGLALGVAALAASPVIAIMLTSAPAAGPAATAASAPIQPAADQQSQPLHANLYELRPKTPLPSPTPKPTPPPTPAPTPQHRTQQAVIPPAASGNIASIIRAAAARYGVSGDWMVKIATCESTLRSNAYNPSGPYYGLFQFLMSTFKANGGTNIWDPTDQANVAARMLANGQAWQWSCA